MSAVLHIEPPEQAQALRAAFDRLAAGYEAERDPPHAARIDRMVKGLARGDIWDEFLQLALRLTRPARAH